MTVEGSLLQMVKGRGVVSLVGNTPMVRLSRLERPDGPKIYAKLEMLNPGGSVKDRPAVYMILDGVRRGLLTREKTILDATSGNTGVAYSMVAAALGYRVKMVVPANASRLKVAKMLSLGAEIVFTDPLEGMDGAIKKAVEIYESDPDMYFYPDQYSNPMNPRAHYETTGPEIMAQTGGRITHLIAGVGTSGTLAGTSQYLRERRPGVRIVEVQPEGEFHGIEGLKNMNGSMRPSLYRDQIGDMLFRIPTEEAEETARKLLLKEGIPAGTSSGAALAAALRLSVDLDSGLIVVILPDGLQVGGEGVRRVRP
ncbi:MAG: cysteine synthase family protein [Nitrososphaerota archaeon]